MFIRIDEIILLLSVQAFGSGSDAAVHILTTAVVPRGALHDTLESGAERALRFIAE